MASTMRNGVGGRAGGGVVALHSPVFKKYYYLYPGLAAPPRHLIKRIATWRCMDADNR
jgi:hypothetical protein